MCVRVCVWARTDPAHMSAKQWTMATPTFGTHTHTLGSGERRGGRSVALNWAQLIFSLTFCVVLLVARELTIRAVCVRVCAISHITLCVCVCVCVCVACTICGFNYAPRTQCTMSRRCSCQLIETNAVVLIPCNFQAGYIQFNCKMLNICSLHFATTFF